VLRAILPESDLSVEALGGRESGIDLPFFGGKGMAVAIAQMEAARRATLLHLTAGRETLLPLSQGAQGRGEEPALNVLGLLLGDKMRNSQQKRWRERSPGNTKEVQRLPYCSKDTGGTGMTGSSDIVDNHKNIDIIREVIRGTGDGVQVNLKYQPLNFRRRSSATKKLKIT